MTRGEPSARISGRHGYTLVDDILVFADNEDQLLKRFTAVVKACDNAHITLSAKKLQLGEEIKFAGLMISSRGVKPSVSKRRWNGTITSSLRSSRGWLPRSDLNIYKDIFQQFY